MAQGVSSFATVISVALSLAVAACNDDQRTCAGKLTDWDGPAGPHLPRINNTIRLDDKRIEWNGKPISEAVLNDRMRMTWELNPPNFNVFLFEGS